MKRFLAAHKLLRIGLCAVLTFSLLSLSGCLTTEFYEEEPDVLGSWSHIAEPIERGADWQQIVTNSSFVLGEEKVTGYFGYSADDVEYEYQLEFGSYPCIDGSTVAVPMAIEFARQHLELSDEDATSFTVFSTTHGAYLNLIHRLRAHGAFLPSLDLSMDNHHPVDIIIATEPSEDELAIAKEFNVKLVYEPVCYDAFVFITHRDNPVESLTLDEVRGIYSGAIANWSEVGGEDAPITAYQREENSGSQTAMLNLVMGDTPMLDPRTITIAKGMSGLIDAVAEYQNDAASIGYTYKYYIDTLYMNENIKILQINDVAANEETIQTGRYPLTASYYGVIRGGEEAATGGLFLKWMLSPEGQACISQAGYVPL